MSGAVEKLQDLDRTFATEANGVAVLRGFNRTVLPRQRGNYGREFVNALAVVEEVGHDLIYDSLRDLLA
jgi:hypothetical protein